MQPSISGNAFVGQTLTANNGTWSGTPTFTYQWRRCDAAGANCNDIVPFTAQTYLVQGADSGMTLRVVVTATNGAGATSATTAQTGIVNAAPGNTALPTITGTKAQGQLLTATQGTWSNNPSSFAYQWQRCDSGGANCADIAGATNSTYTLVAGDVGSTIRVKVTATNPSGSTSGNVQPDGSHRHAPGEHGLADDHRDGSAGADADRRQRDLVEQPDLHVSVASV